MFGSYFFVFFEGEAKERVALEFKELVEDLLGEEAGVGRAFERPWEDPEQAERVRTKTGPGDPGHEGPWSFARCVFEIPSYEEHFRRELEGEAFDEEAFALDGFEEEDSSLYLFGDDMPPEWREAPVTISFPPFALPAQAPEDRQASRPKAKKILRWLVRQEKRLPVKVLLSARFFAPAYFEPREVSAARLLRMALELEDPAVAEPASTSPSLDLDLDLSFENPETRRESSKDDESWPGRIWRRGVS